MKLKTLKDLIKKAKKEDELSFGGYTEDYLKDEAVKWVKKGFYDELGIIWGEEIKKWIKHFFNLTEEDFKK